MCVSSELGWRACDVWGLLLLLRNWTCGRQLFRPTLRKSSSWGGSALEGLQLTTLDQGYINDERSSDFRNVQL